MEKPRLWKEIAKVALIFGKLGLGIGVPMFLMFLVMRNHPLTGIGLSVGGMICFTGYISYKDKRREFERRLEDEAREKEWKAARDRVHGDRTAS